MYLFFQILSPNLLLGQATKIARIPGTGLRGKNGP